MTYRGYFKQNLANAGALIKAGFTRHPEQTGETYLQHLWFTLTMVARLLFAGTVLLIHGLLPFLFTRTASTQIERLYRIMKSRIPDGRRQAIDAEYEI